MSVENYVHAFHLLERHAYMLTEERRVDGFIRGLNFTLKMLVDNANPTTFEQAQNIALKQERNLGLSKAPGLGYLGLAESTFSIGLNSNPTQSQKS